MEEPEGSSFHSVGVTGAWPPETTAAWTTVSMAATRGERVSMSFVGVLLLGLWIYGVAVAPFGFLRRLVRNQVLDERRSLFLVPHVALAGASLFLRLAFAGWVALLVREHVGGTWGMWPVGFGGLVTVWLFQDLDRAFDAKLLVTDVGSMLLVAVGYVVSCAAPGVPTQLFGGLYAPIEGFVRSLGWWLALPVWPLSVLAVLVHLRVAKEKKLEADAEQLAILIANGVVKFP